MTKQKLEPNFLSGKPNAYIFKTADAYWLEVDLELALELFENCEAELCIYYPDSNSETMVEESVQLIESDKDTLIGIFLGKLRSEEDSEDE